MIGCRGGRGVTAGLRLAAKTGGGGAGRVGHCGWVEPVGLLLHCTDLVCWRTTRLEVDEIEKSCNRKLGRTKPTNTNMAAAQIAQCT